MEGRAQDSGETCSKIAFTNNSMESDKTQEIEKKLNGIKMNIMEVIKKYQILEKNFLMSKFNLDMETHLEVKKFDIAVEIIEDKLKLCDLDLKVLEVEETKNCFNESESKKKVEELERKLKETTEELSKQKAIQKEMETSFKESKQKRVEHMKILLEELRKYLTHIDAFNTEEIRRKPILEKFFHPRQWSESWPC